jgi:hypothetical protein
MAPGVAAGVSPTGLASACRKSADGRFEEVPQLPFQLQKSRDVLAQRSVSTADVVKIGGSSRRIVDGQGRVEDLAGIHGGRPVKAPPPPL